MDLSEREKHYIFQRLMITNELLNEILSALHHEMAKRDKDVIMMRGGRSNPPGSRAEREQKRIQRLQRGEADHTASILNQLIRYNINELDRDTFNDIVMATNYAIHLAKKYDISISR